MGARHTSTKLGNKLATVYENQNVKTNVFRSNILCVVDHPVYMGVVDILVGWARSAVLFF